MPVFKSVLDYWVLMYVFASQKLSLPFTFVNTEELPAHQIVRDLFRKSGLVFQERQQEKGLQHEFINIQLLKETLNANNSIQIYLNAHKLRQNRIAVATKPEASVVYLLEAYRQLMAHQKHIYIVPVVLTYDRIPELEIISKEILT